MKRKFLLNVEQEVMIDVIEMAKKEDRSINNMLNQLILLGIEQKIKKDEKN